MTDEADELIDLTNGLTITIPVEHLSPKWVHSVRVSTYEGSIKLQLFGEGKEHKELVANIRLSPEHYERLLEVLAEFEVDTMVEDGLIKEE